MWGFGGKKKKAKTEQEDESDLDLSSDDEDLGGRTVSFASTESTSKASKGSKENRKKKSSKKNSTKRKKKKGPHDDDNDDDEEDDDSDVDGSSSKKSKQSKTKKKGKGKEKEKKRNKREDEFDDDDLFSTKRRKSKKEKQQEENKKKELQEAMSKEQASRELITANELKMKIDPEDFESKKKHLKGTQIQDYVSVPILADEGPISVSNVKQISHSNATQPVFERQGDVDNCQGRVLVPKGGSSRFTMSRGSRWKEEVFVENLSSGGFSRVLYDLNEQGQREVIHHVRNEESISEYSPQKLQAHMHNVEYILEGMFMVGQGLLAGGSLFQLIVVFQIKDPYTLLAIYGPLAREVRRMFFFLSVFSFVGVCDKITAQRDQKKNWATRSSKEKAELYLYGIFFFVCLVLALVMWPFVDKIDDAYLTFIETPNFTIDADFSASLELWKIYIGLRFGFAALGWILVCKDTNRDLLRGRQRSDVIDKCHEELEQKDQVVARLSGKLLDGASYRDLQTLSRTLATGLEEVRLQLELRSKIQSPPGHHAKSF